MMDKIAFIAATRHGRVPFVTASCDRVDFRAPARLGQLVEVTALPVRVGRTSLGIDVKMVVEDLLSGDRQLCTRGSFVMAAIPGDRPKDWRLPQLSAIDIANDQRMEMSDLAVGDQASSLGGILGGHAISRMTKAAYIAASRHCRQSIALVSTSEIEFDPSAVVGSIIDVNANIISADQKSIDLSVELWCEDPITGVRNRVATARVMLATVDEKQARSQGQLPDLPGAMSSVADH